MAVCGIFSAAVNFAAPAGGCLLCGNPPDPAGSQRTNCHQRTEAMDHVTVARQPGRPPECPPASPEPRMPYRPDCRCATQQRANQTATRPFLYPIAGTNRATDRVVAPTGPTPGNWAAGAPADGARRTGFLRDAQQLRHSWGTVTAVLLVKRLVFRKVLRCCATFTRRDTSIRGHTGIYMRVSERLREQREPSPAGATAQHLLPTYSLTTTTIRLYGY